MLLVRFISLAAGDEEYKVAVKAEEPSSSRVRSRNRVSGFIPSEREILEYLVEMMLKEKLEKLNIKLDDEEFRRLQDRAYRYALDYTFDYGC